MYVQRTKEGRFFYRKRASSLGHCCPEKYLRVIIFVEDEELGDVMDERSNEVGEYLVKAQEKNFDQECQQMDLHIFFSWTYDPAPCYEVVGKS